MTEESYAQDPAPVDGPWVNVVLLKFGDSHGGGRDTYMRYATPVRKLIRQLGGRHLFYGRPLDLGRSSPFDETIANEYPSVRSFREMTSSPKYQAVAPFRAQGLQAGGGRGYTGGCLPLAASRLGRCPLLFGPSL